jgi:glycosyltransferase involved in cell wall biosynthesis
MQIRREGQSFKVTAAMELELSIVMPCLNEARTLPACIERAHRFLREYGVSGEVIIADNGSTDGSVEIARNMDAKVVVVDTPGYGAALAQGIEAAEGKYVIMGDSDESYDFSAVFPFVEKLRAGYDLVMGNRFKGGIAPGAMPLMHRYFGNPFLTAVGRLFFSCKECGDFYCGLRGFRRETIQALKLQSRGMEFALEMVVKARIHGLRITEIPVTLFPDRRGRPSHLRWYRDGWRSLRFYLLMSPRWFFAIPGMALLFVGVIIAIVLLRGPISVMSITFDYHTLMYSTSAIVLGYQSILLFVFAKLMAIESGLHPPTTKFWFLEQRRTMEWCIVIAVILIIVGVLLGIVAARQWSSVRFGSLRPAVTIRFVICSVLFLLLGGQTLMAGFYFGLINLVAERKGRPSSFREMAESEPIRD